MDQDVIDVRFREIISDITPAPTHLYSGHTYARTQCYPAPNGFYDVSSAARAAGYEGLGVWMSEKLWPHLVGDGDAAMMERRLLGSLAFMFSDCAECLASGTDTLIDVLGTTNGDPAWVKVHIRPHDGTPMALSFTGLSEDALP